MCVYAAHDANKRYQERGGKEERGTGDSFRCGKGREERGVPFSPSSLL